MSRLVWIGGLLVGAPTALVAQQWSVEQQAVIDQAATCWRVWGQEDLAGYDRACPTDPAGRFWWMTEGTPDYGPNEWKRWAAVFFPRIQEVHFEHRPIAVQLFGDVAIYMFWATWSHVDPNGQVQTQAQRRMDIMQRRSGRWVLIGGSGLPEPGN